MFCYNAADDQQWQFEKCDFLISNEAHNAGVRATKYQGKFYPDYTIPLNKLLKSAKDLAETHRCMTWVQYCSWLQENFPTLIPDVSDHASSQLAAFSWFFFQVKSGAVWDIKLENRWKEALPNVPYLGTSKGAFLFRGKLKTAEDMGNILYGYAGRATGFGDVTLYWGGGVANKKSLTDPELSIPPTYGDEENDHMNVEWGIQLCNTDYPNYPSPGFNGIPLEDGIIGIIASAFL